MKLNWLEKYPNIERYANWLLGLSLCTIILLPIFERYVAKNQLTAFAFIFAVVGVSVGGLPWLLKKLPCWVYSKPVYLFFNALVVWGSFSVASSLVSDKLQLPADDYPRTVGLLAILLYIPVWCLILAIVMFLFALLLSILVMAGSFLLTFLRNIVSLLPWQLTSTLRVGALDKLDKKLGELSLMELIKLGGRGLAYVSLVALLVAFFGASKFSLPYITPWIAYYADYHKIGKYPCIKPGEYVVLHANGVVSTAKKVDGQVLIEQRLFNPQCNS